MIRYLIVMFVCAFAIGCGASQYDNKSYAPPMSSGPMYADAESTTGDDAASGPRLTSQARGTAPKAKAAETSIDRKIVKNAWLDVVVKKERDIAPAIKQGELIARRLDGYVTNQTTSSLAFKIPNERLDEALAALAEVGKIKDRKITAMDVTSRYVDLQIRIDNLKKIQKRLQELLNIGQNVQEILEVEKELGRITTQLEALEGQMRLLNNQTTFATVTMNVRERVLPGPIGWVFYGAYHAVKWLFVWD